MFAKIVENKRAAYAFEIVESTYGKLTEKQREEYRSYIKKMPMMIKVNGLGQTFAFYFSKGETYKIIYDQVGKWLLDYYAQELNLTEEDRRKRPIDVIIHLPSDQYRMATMESVSVLDWMRRFVDGLSKEGKNGKDKQDKGEEA
jgi:CRISPR-associated protein Cmr5